MDDRQFRDAMGKFATGITIVTIDEEEAPQGMTVNAFMSVSLHPKLIAISIDYSASLYDQLYSKNKFGISILTKEQKELAQVFARQKQQTDPIHYQQLDGVPILENAMAALACKVKDKIPAGDHLMYIAEVTDLIINEGDPTLFFGGQYRELLQS